MNLRSGFALAGMALVASVSVGCSTSGGGQRSPTYQQLRDQAEAVGMRTGYSVSKDGGGSLTFDVLSLEGSDGAGGAARIRRAWVNYPAFGFQEADSARCPAVMAVIQDFAAIEIPHLRAGDINDHSNRTTLEGPAGDNLTEGPHFSVRTRGRFENQSSTALEFGAGNSSSVARWFDFALSRLESCWRNVAAP